MSDALTEFCQDTRAILKQQADRAGLDKVRAKMETLVTDPQFVKSHFHDGMGEGLTRIYSDPELGFEVMTYRHDHARGSKPHDHGDSWAIYCQVRGYTDMKEWKRTDDGKSRECAALEMTREYRLDPGQAGIYYGNELHSTSTGAGARYLRVTGTDLENIERLRIDETSGAIEHIHGRQT